MTIQISPTAAVSDAGAVGASFGSGVGVLALTGSGPGTIILALAGLGSLLVGAAAMVTGRSIAPRNTATDALPDLSRRALDT